MRRPLQRRLGLDIVVPAALLVGSSCCFFFLLLLSLLLLFELGNKTAVRRDRTDRQGRWYRRSVVVVVVSNRVPVNAAPLGKQLAIQRLFFPGSLAVMLLLLLHFLFWSRGDMMEEVCWHNSHARAPALTYRRV